MNKTRPKWDATRNLIYLSGLPVGYLIMVKLGEMGLPNLVTLLIGILGIIVWWVLFFALQDKFLSSHKRRFAQENEEIRRAYHESGDAQAFYEALQNRKEQPKTQEERVVQQINLSTALNNLGQTAPGGGEPAPGDPEKLAGGAALEELPPQEMVVVYEMVVFPKHQIDRTERINLRREWNGLSTGI